MTSPNRILLASVTAAVAAVLATACNDSKTVNRTIPPIAGVTVGGPTDTAGNGTVAVQVNEATATVSPNTIMRVLNLTRGVENTVQSSAAGTSIATLPVQGDVGDELRVTLNLIGFGNAFHDYDVPSVAVTGVSSSLGESKVAPHLQATVHGAGFCLHELGANRVFIDGSALAPGMVLHANEGEILFMAPETLSTSGTGVHTLSVSVAGASVDNPVYSSGTINFTAVPAI